ncbi:MAG: glycosyltransferase 61 family protein [Verrucomicrobiales bacterium]
MKTETQPRMPKWRRSQTRIVRMSNALWAHLNHLEIVHRLDGTSRLVVKHVGYGSVEHYFHFIFDLLLPVFGIVKRTPSNSTKLCVETPGPFTQIFSEMYPAVQLLPPNEVKTSQAMDLVGLNPRWTLLGAQHLEDFKRDTAKRLSVRLSHQRNKIVLIERLPPLDFYISEAQVKGSGTMRRSILNHGELKAMCQSLVRPEYEFHNVQLENMTLREQVSLFDETCVVIGQHGAGLANASWMKNGSVMVELNMQNRLEHFMNLSRPRGLTYLRYLTYSDHAMIDPEHFAVWISKQPALAPYMR